VHSEGTDAKLLQQLEDRDDGGAGGGNGGGDFDIEEDWDPDNNGEGVVLGGQAQEDARDSSKSEWSASFMRSRHAIVNGGSNYDSNLTDSADFGEGNFDGATSAQDRMHATARSKRGAEDGAGETHYEGGAAAHFARIEVNAIDRDPEGALVNNVLLGIGCDVCLSFLHSLRISLSFLL